MDCPLNNENMYKRDITFNYANRVNTEVGRNYVKNWYNTDIGICINVTINNKGIIITADTYLRACIIGEY